jgi:hypothetical protein
LEALLEHLEALLEHFEALQEHFWEFLNILNHW